MADDKMQDKMGSSLMVTSAVAHAADTSALRRAHRRRAIFFTLCLLFWSIVFSIKGYYRGGQSSEVSLAAENAELVWDKLPSLPPLQLHWEDCYNDYFKCARMTVPLDYAEPHIGSASIALIKYPAKVPADHKEYKGPIIFNFGGPGSSGVSIVSVLGPIYQELFGQEYDIVSWDPRGIARTTPQVRFFPDSAEGAAFRMRLQEDPPPNVTDDALSRLHARWSTLGDIAAARTEHTSPYVSTTLVARDLLNIARSFGREKLQYVGYSYGTVIGATFAAMFPGHQDHIERMVLDGVVDIYDCVTSRWEKHLRDTDKVIQLFADECVEAGATECALYEPTPKQVLARLHKLLDNLKKSPVAVPISETTLGSYGLINYKHVKETLLKFAYTPYSDTILGAPHLATALHELENGNGVPLWTQWLGRLQERFECACHKFPQGPNLQTPHTQQAVMCSDGEKVDDTVEEIEEYFARLSKTSEFADVMAPRVACVGWKLPAVERFAGPFVGNTSYPILFIGNSYDPVTPLANAHTVSKGFNGSIVLKQNSAGHCSLAASSACTARSIRAYMRDGELPEPGTVCEIESGMFGRQPSAAAEEFAGEDRVVVRAWRQLSGSFPVPPLGMPFAPAFANVQV